MEHGGWGNQAPVRPERGILPPLSLSENVALVPWLGRNLHFLICNTQFTWPWLWAVGQRFHGVTHSRHAVCLSPPLPPTHTMSSLLQRKKLRLSHLSCFAKAKWPDGDRIKIGTEVPWLPGQCFFYQLHLFMSDLPSKTKCGLSPPEPRWLRKWGASAWAVAPGRHFCSWLWPLLFSCKKTPHVRFVNISASVPFRCMPEDVCVERQLSRAPYPKLPSAWQALGVFCYSVFPRQACWMLSSEFLLPRESPVHRNTRNRSWCDPKVSC